MPQLITDGLEALKGLAGALAPAALGSAVAQAYQGGLSWRERIAQWGVGIAVSWYVTLGLTAMLHLGPFAAQSLGFVIATFAFHATPRFIAAAGDAVAKLPDRLINMIPGIKPADKEGE